MMDFGSIALGGTFNGVPFSVNSFDVDYHLKLNRATSREFWLIHSKRQYEEEDMDCCPSCLGKDSHCTCFVLNPTAAKTMLKLHLISSKRRNLKLTKLAEKLDGGVTNLTILGDLSSTTIGCVSREKAGSIVVSQTCSEQASGASTTRSGRVVHARNRSVEELQFKEACKIHRL